jgi:hypothetical protein
MFRIFVCFLIILPFSPNARADEDTVCLIMGFHEPSLMGIDADLKNYKSIAKNTGCRIVQGNERDLSHLGKEAFLKKIAAQTGSAKNIMFMYSGHGQCVDNFDPSENGSPKPKPHFAMDARNQDQCMVHCKTGDDACKEQCKKDRLISDTDMSLIFRDKSVTAMVDSCGSGCLNPDGFGTKNFSFLSSGIGNQSTLETHQGGQLNLRLEQLLNSPEICNADSDSNGQISFAEIHKYFDMGTNNRFSPLAPTPIADFSSTYALVSQKPKITTPLGAQNSVIKRYDRSMCSGGSGRNGKAGYER